MKKIFLLLVFFHIVISSFAQKAPAGSLFIEGTAHIESYIAYFYERFTEEAIASGYTVAESREEAAFTLKYKISDNTGNLAESTSGEASGNTGSSAVNTEETELSEPSIKITIINNSDNEEILSFEYYFRDLNEMYDYTQILFEKAALSMPLPRKSDFIDISWQNKLMYLSVSFDYPITFFALQPDGLLGGAAVYYKNDSGIQTFNPEDNKVLAMPGVTIGYELQFLNFMSFELNLQLSLGDTRDNNFVNLSAGAQLKFPLKFFQHIVIEPYLAFTLPITVSEIFSEYPALFTGGGLQVGTKGGKNGSFFIDAGFMFSFTKTGMHNPWIEKEAFPEPPVIYYNQYILKLAVGYKHGFINKKNSKLLINYY